jgi:hypothetical protein
LVTHRCHEAQGRLEREIAGAGTRLPQRTADVVLMGTNETYANGRRPRANLAED